MYSIDLTDLLERQCVDKLSWRERKLHSTTFLTRWGHSSAVHDGKIYIFGGRFSSDLNDVLAADIAKNTMTTLKVSSADVPKARRRHSACFIGSNMLVFGGFNGYYFNDLHYINVF